MLVERMAGAKQWHHPSPQQCLHWRFDSIFTGPKSNHCLACLGIPSLLFVRLDWCDSGVWRFTQPLPALPAVVSFDSHVVDIGTKQKPCCSFNNRTNPMLLMSEQNKSPVVDRWLFQPIIEEAHSDGKATRWMYDWNKRWICKGFEPNLRFGTVFKSSVELTNKRVGVGVFNGFIGLWSTQTQNCSSYSRFKSNFSFQLRFHCLSIDV